MESAGEHVSAQRLSLVWPDPNDFPLRKMKIGFVSLHGDVPSRKRGELIDKFHRDAECRVFLSTDTGGVGLNLQAASAVINLELPWNPARLEQRIGRIGDLCLPPALDLTPRRLEIPLDTIYANRECVDQVEALGMLCENRLKDTSDNVAKFEFTVGCWLEPDQDQSSNPYRKQKPTTGIIGAEAAVGS